MRIKGDYDALLLELENGTIGSKLEMIYSPS